MVVLCWCGGVHHLNVHTVSINTVLLTVTQLQTTTMTLKTQESLPLPMRLCFWWHVLKTNLKSYGWILMKCSENVNNGKRNIRVNFVDLNHHPDPGFLKESYHWTYKQFRRGWPLVELCIL